MKEEELSVLVSVSNKTFAKTMVVAHIAIGVVNEVLDNAEFYSDFCKFNFANHIKVKNYEQTQVYFSDLPHKENKRLMRLERRFGEVSKKEIFKALNMPHSDSNLYSPLQQKWAYEYIKKFKTNRYITGNELSDDEILRPLTAKEKNSL